LAKYEMTKMIVKNAVAEVQQWEKNKFGEKLNMEEGQRSVSGIAKNRLAEERQDAVEVNCLRDDNGSIVVKPEMEGVYGAPPERRECVEWNGRRWDS